MRINKLLLIMMVSLLALGGCQNDDASSNQLIHASATGDDKIPVLWVYESESLYQPTFGNLTQKGFENFSKEKIQMDASGLSFTLQPKIHQHGLVKIRLMYLFIIKK